MTSKAAIVTGSATGIGRATAWLLAERGYSIAVNYSKSVAEAEETADGVRGRGQRVIVIKADVADEAAVVSMVGEASSALGRLDLLVNNAATTRFIPHDDLDALTDDVWLGIFRCNLLGAFYACRAAMPHLSATGGSIVNVASVAGIAGSGSSIPYAASKGALITLTKSLAVAFAPRVRVNAVAPGPVNSRWLAGHEDMVRAAMARTPLGRSSEPEDIAEAIVHLAGSAITTGQVLVLDGGRTI